MYKTIKLEIVLCEWFQIIKNVFHIFKYDAILGKEMLDLQNCITTTASLMFESYNKRDKVYTIERN
jgi:hypothetical protein